MWTNSDDFFCCVIWPSNDLSTTFAVDLDRVTCRSCPCNHVHITPVNWWYWSQMVKSCKLRVLVNRVTFSCQITWLGLEKILCPVFWFKHALFHNVNYAFESYVWYTSGKVSGLYICKKKFLDLAWNTGNINDAFGNAIGASRDTLKEWKQCHYCSTTVMLCFPFPTITC